MVPLKREALRFSETSRIAHPTTQRHMGEDLGIIEHREMCISCVLGVAINGAVSTELCSCVFRCAGVFC